jgi:hypothetical protein
VCPEGRFKDFSLLGSMVLAWGGFGLRFAFAGPLKIQIWRPSKSDQKTCQKHVNLEHFGAFVAQVPFSSFCVVGLHGFGEVRKAASGGLGLGVLICFGRETVIFPETVVLKLRSPTTKKLSSGWGFRKKNHLMRF